MDIRVFFGVSLSLALAMAFYEIKNDNTVQNYQKIIPNIVFENSQAYKLDTNAVTHVITSKKAEVYKNKEKFEKFSMVTLNNNNKQQYNFINADLAFHNKNIYDLSKNVEIQKWDGVLFHGNDIIYDVNKNLVTSKSFFTIEKEKHKYTGESLIYDLSDNSIRSNDTHISILLKD
jgi:hypothetical protein